MLWKAEWDINRTVPYTFEIFESDELILVTAKGTIDVKSIIASLEEVSEASGFKSNYKLLADLRKMKFNPTDREQKVLAEYLGGKKAFSHNRIAVLVNGRKRLRILETVCFSASLVGLNFIMAFTDIKEAKDWLSFEE